MGGPRPFMPEHPPRANSLFLCLRSRIIAEAVTSAGTESIGGMTGRVAQNGEISTPRGVNAVALAVREVVRMRVA